MGKKGKLYLVVLINLLAWGYVGYKVYGALQGDDEQGFSTTSLPVKAIDEAKKEEPLNLSLSYQDPFLKDVNFGASKHVGQGGSARKPSNVKPSVTAAAVAKPTPSVAATPAVTIRYLGSLKNNDKGTQTAMLSVNERSVFVKLNEVIEGYTVVEISRDFVRLKKGKEVLNISK